jgi:hypothetical protein
MLMKIFQRHNDQMAELVGHEFSKGTYTRYKTVYTFALSFLQWKYKVTDMDISKLDYEFISQFEFWLKTVRKCNHNTTMQYLRNFNNTARIPLLAPAIAIIKRYESHSHCALNDLVLPVISNQKVNAS